VRRSACRHARKHAGTRVAAGKRSIAQHGTALHWHAHLDLDVPRALDEPLNQHHVVAATVRPFVR
jgi:hypothetical protein